MNLSNKIAALPEWGNPEAAEFDDEAVMALSYSLAAALARLELAREWINESGHFESCNRRDYETGFSNSDYCDCGLDMMLAALEVK